MGMENEVYLEFSQYIDYDERARIYESLRPTRVTMYASHNLSKYRCVDHGRYKLYFFSAKEEENRQAIERAMEAAVEDEHRKTIEFYHPNVEPSWWDDDLTAYKLEQMFGTKVKCINGSPTRIVLPCYLNTKENRDKVNELLR